ncbi:Uncharacterised protein [uncultured archaeon]|nr:Uncharacterised protein [uncultured archaeon]
MAKMKGMCMLKQKGVAMLVLGVLILINVYWPMLTWWAFVGWVFALGGLLKLLMPHKHSEYD